MKTTFQPRPEEEKRMCTELKQILKETPKDRFAHLNTNGSEFRIPERRVVKLSPNDHLLFWGMEVS